MRHLRQVYGWTASQVAREFGCHVSHISRVERGSAKPSRDLIDFYEAHFEANGLLRSLHEVVEHAAEQARRRFGGHRPRRVRTVEGDATAFVDDTVPHGTVLQPGVLFAKTWRIRNAGIVPWRGRNLERQGPVSGPGLITSPRLVAVPDTEPGEIAEIQAVLKAPGYDCSSIAYFKMVDSDGFLCFPDDHSLGLDVLVRVVRNVGGEQ